MGIIKEIAIEQANFTRQMAENGYTTKTTFMTDFAIADRFGEKAIRDTYNRAKTEWGKNIEYMTELAMVLNTRCWQYAEKYIINNPLGDVYKELYYDCDEYIMGDNNPFTDEERTYYFHTTD